MILLPENRLILWLSSLGPIFLVLIVRKRQALCLVLVSPLHIISREDSIDGMDLGLHSSSHSEKTILFVGHALHRSFCSQRYLGCCVSRYFV